MPSGPVALMGYGIVAIVSAIVTFYLFNREQSNRNRPHAAANTPSRPPSSNSNDSSRSRSPPNSGNKQQSKYSGGNEEENICPLCLYGLTVERKYMLECCHNFHEKCLKEYFKNEFKTCPICKHKIHPHLINHMLNK